MDLQTKTISEIVQLRNLVLKAFSHDNTEKHEIRTEPESAIPADKYFQEVISSNRRFWNKIQRG